MERELTKLKRKRTKKRRRNTRKHVSVRVSKNNDDKDRKVFKKIRQRTKKERRKKLESILSKYRNKDGTRKESSIEKKVRKFLENNGIPHVPEYKIQLPGQKARYFDFYIELGADCKFIAETDGNFFHAYEYKEGDVPYNKLRKVQKKNIQNDKRKNKIAKAAGIPILRFWESDIKNAFCKKVAERIYNEIYSQIGKKWKTDKRSIKKIKESLGKFSDSTD